MIVGENARPDEMDVNPTKEKKLTNHRAAGSDDLVRLVPPRVMSLEQALEFIADDECVEVTPKNVRLRKLVFAGSEHARQAQIRQGRLASSNTVATGTRRLARTCGSALSARSKNVFMARRISSG